MKEEYFIEENRVSTNSYFSESGKYRLEISEYTTKKGCWNYTSGSVFEVSSNKLIATVNKNYSDFQHLFIESHPNQHDYLVCGESYQGQTIIELDTGIRKDYLPKFAEKGAGFCWTSYYFDFNSQILIVIGCLWACPSEYRFYDFHDPLNFFQLESEECIESDERKPLIDNGTITTYRTQYIEYDFNLSEEENEKIINEAPIATATTFNIENDKLVKVYYFESDAEKERVEGNRIADEKYEAWEKWFLEEDPLYVTYKKFMTITELLKVPEWGVGIGQTFDGWVPEFKVIEQRYSINIYKTDILHISLEWGTETGPIKLDYIISNIKQESFVFMEHTPENMQLALEMAELIVKLSVSELI